MSRRAWRYVLVLAIVGSACYVVAHLIADEVRTSRWQAHYLSQFGKRLSYAAQPGPSDSIRFPQSGPYDHRLGYSSIPHYTERLEARGFVREAQVRMSPDLLEYLNMGLFAPYREKTQAGLELLDCNDRAVSRQRFPQREYAGIADVPVLLSKALLFVENQGLLNPEYPTRNPALDWRRLSRASLDQMLRIVDKSRDTPGGSTLATQIEKYRHSPEGRTTSVSEKFRQMGSASVRAYLDGPDSVRARERIVVDYLNTVPLAARNGYGEVHGIGDGMWYWYGEDFDEYNELLRAAARGTPGKREAQVFKQALSLIIAQRRPSYHLRGYETGLEPLTDSYIRLLANAGAISPELRDAALAASLHRTPPPGRDDTEPFVTRKAVNQVRADLSRVIGIQSRYDLDRLDLTVGSSINTDAQRVVTDVLLKLRDKQGARELGLYGHNMLRDHDDPSRLNASFTLFERVGNVSFLRVQADNIDQPFDLNSGARLNLGSTAKLRTLVTYLEIVAELHDRFGGLTRAELLALPVAPQDGLSRWAVDYLAKAKDAERDRPAMLEAAMERKYAGGAGEAFFTGGGLQAFSNFERSETVPNMTVRRAFQHSVNLVFVRMMRDIVRYEIYRAHPDAADMLADRAAPERRVWLERFADQEGSAFLTGFYRRYQGLDHERRMAVLLQRTKPIAVRTAVSLRSGDPDIDEQRFARLMREKLPQSGLDDEDLSTLYRKYAKDKFSLNDRGYLSKVHPLELWLVDYLRERPDATLEQVLRDSAEVRQETYSWLFKTRSKYGQDNRIRTLLEQDAFVKIGERWRRLGYPFETLTPSYGTAIGASGDRPAALSELIGIVLSGGVQPYTETLRRLDFAVGTPYETRFALRPLARQRLLPQDVATVVRRSLTDVVESGTARSMLGAFPPDPRLALGGKTGTGDHRHMVYGRGGRVIAVKTVSRSATFVFALGDRYFGTVTLHVRGPEAARYAFTSALSLRLLRGLAPSIVAMNTPADASASLRCKH